MHLAVTDARCSAFSSPLEQAEPNGENVFMLEQLTSSEINLSYYSNKLTYYTVASNLISYYAIMKYLYVQLYNITQCTQKKTLT